MKIFSIVGARPEFVQAMPVSQALANRHEEILVHTGQHYDYRMSQIFFDELPIPTPHYNLEIGSGSHGQQTAQLLTRLEELMRSTKPDVVIVRGDTNSTLGGALAASKLQIPLVHIEAGERSFNRQMPEEINRLAVDAISDLHLCVSRKAVRQLGNEGRAGSAHWVGDVMLDALLQSLPIAQKRSQILRNLGLQTGTYGLVTVHRAANVGDSRRLTAIIQALNTFTLPIIFPVHPRTYQAIAGLEVTPGRHIQLIEPVGYLDMMMLAANALRIATDSGGLQREAYYLRVPCLTLRDETEWSETVQSGWNRLVGAQPDKIIEGWQNFITPSIHPPALGDGKAAERILANLEIFLGVADVRAQREYA